MAARFITKRLTTRKVVRPRPNSSIPHKIEMTSEDTVVETLETDVIDVIEPVVTEVSSKSTTVRKAKARKANTPKDEEIVEEVKLTEEDIID